jgi:hypothetical protein
MIYEKRIVSFPKLMSEIRRLDSDAGIRMICNYEGRRCFLFLTKSIGGYVVMVHAIVGDPKRPAPGDRLLAQEFSGAAEVEQFLRSVARDRLDAFAY